MLSALKLCAVACTVNVGFPFIVTQLWNENEVGKFATLTLKALWRKRESNHMRALIAGDTSDALKRH